MNQLNHVNKFSIIYILLILNIVFANQNDLNGARDEQLQQTFKEDASDLLNSVSKNLNQESIDNDLLSAFDSSIYYKIDWKERPKDLVINESIVTLTTEDLNNYHCVLPKVEQQEQGHKEDANIDPYSKIEHLFSHKTCIHKLDSYWTYEICLDKHVRQFNGDMLERKHTQEYYLGFFYASNLEKDRTEYNKRIAELKSQGKKVPRIDYDGVKVPFVYITMNKGTICDLTNKPRVTTVYFVCDKYDKPQLESIEEVQSCEYEAIVSTNLLCDHPDFKEKKENELEINCFPQNDEQQIKPNGIEQYETKPLDLHSDTILQQIHEMVSNSKFKIELETLNKDNTKIRTVDKSKFMDNFEGREMTFTSFLKAKHCYMSTFKSYWKYSFCFKKSIKMFHEEGGIKTKTISLGKFDEAKHLNWIDANPKRKKSSTEVNYLFSDGDICHETHKLRFVEVKLKCPEIDTKQFSMTLEEPKLCEYRLTLESGLICKLLQSVDENGL